MANNKRTKSKTTKTTYNKKNTSSKKPVNKKNQKHKVQISAIILFGTSLLLGALVLVPGQNIWNILHNIILGIFGFTAYLLPLLLIYISIKVNIDENICSIKPKLIQAGLLLAVLSGFIQTTFIGEYPGENFFDSLINLYTNGEKLQSSGLISSLIGWPLMSACGRVGATIIYIIMAIVLILIFSGNTVVDAFKIFSKPVEHIENEYVRKREEREEQEKEEIQQAKRVNCNERDYSIDIPIGPFKNHKSKFNKNDNIDFIELDKALNTKINKTIDEKSPAETFLETVNEYKDTTPQKHEVNKEKQLDDLIEKALPIKEKTPIKIDDLTENNQKTENCEKIKLEEEEKEQLSKEIENQINQEKKVIEYKKPPLSFLKAPVNKVNQDLSSELKANAEVLVNTLKSFGVETRIIDISRGPTVTRYELQPSAGVKISKITNLADDIALNLAAGGVRIEAPIPNKAAVGIEIPNKKTEMVSIREVIDSDSFKNFDSKLAVALGRDISGKEIVFDIAKMPHMLIAGATGSGKSVCINTLIMSILYKSTPEEVKLLMIDPKVVELGIYNGIPHLLVPVVTDPRKAAGALGWAVTEMLNRYKLFADNQVRDINGYNDLAKDNPEISPLPQVVIIIDELADLMMASPKEVEDYICRLAQMARAAGMHLVIATQRPSVDVITGVIKANIPSRIAFSVSSQVDSRTIIDSGGAEKLLGRGDMLFAPSGYPKPIRVQCCYVSDKEVEAVVKFVKNEAKTEYDDNIINEIEKQSTQEPQKNNTNANSSSDDEDELIPQAIDLVVEAGQASTSYLQRRLKVGYARAARLIDEMEVKGIVGPFEGSKPRQVLISKNDWYELKLNKQQELENNNNK